MRRSEATLLADALKALAHPARVLIVDALARGERCVGELKRLVNVDQSNVSRHLAVLKRVGIVAERRAGMRTYHRLQTPCILKALDCALEVVRREADRRRGLLRPAARRAAKAAT